MLGSVHLPNGDARPAWATYASFEFHLAKTGAIKELRVTTIDSSDRLTIRDSIGSRFGVPSMSTLQAVGQGSSIWARNDIYISLLCDNKCWVEFRTPEAQADREKQIADRAKKNAEKPLTP